MFNQNQILKIVRSEELLRFEESRGYGNTLGDNGVQNFHFGSKTVRLTVTNSVFLLGISRALNLLIATIKSTIYFTKCKF